MTAGEEFHFSGTFRLDLEQRRGDIEPDLEADVDAPSFRTQELKTSLVLEDMRWSCAGGVKTWRQEKRNQFLGSKLEESQDLIIIFVRPRSFLKVPGLAVPAGSQSRLRKLSEQPIWTNEGHPLLPSKGWYRVPGKR